MYKCIVIGAGSIGKRTVDNLITLGHNVSIAEIDKERSSQLKEQGYKVYDTIDSAFSKDSYDICFVCTGTDTHISIWKTLAKKNINGLYIQKPLSYNLCDVGTLLNLCKENNIKFGSACNMLYLSGIRLLKTLLSNNAIGEVYSGSYFFGHNLKKWNDRDYKATYSAGEFGGILLDDSHSIYLCEDVFGDIVEYNGCTHKSKILEISNEDAFEISGKTDKNILVRIHGDYLACEYTRNIEIFGTSGCLQWEMFKKDDGNIESYVYLKTEKIPETRVFNVSEPLNEMYIREISAFIEFVEGKKESFHNGVSELEIITEMRDENK